MSPVVAENKEYTSPQKRKMKEKRITNAIGPPAISVTMKIRIPSIPKAMVIVYSLPNLSEIEPHKILERAFAMEVRVAVKGTIAIPHTFTSATLRDLAIWDRFPVAIRPPVQAKRNMIYKR